MESPEDGYEKDTYALFSEKVKPEEFSKRYRSMEEKTRGRFLRSCYAYVKALNLKESEADISMCLLCIAVESTIDPSRLVTFKDWLVKKRLDRLSGKSEKELQNALNALFEEFIETEEEREGPTYNFKRFLLRYCPEKIRNPPMKISPRGGVLREATFEEAVRFIYARFRSLFVHQGIGRLGRPPSSKEVSYSGLADKFGKDYYSINLPEVEVWFAKVVLESVWSWFSSIQT